MKKPELEGRVILNFTISADGSVAKSKTYRTTMNDEATEACLNSQMKLLRFPQPKGRGIVIAKYPSFSAQTDGHNQGE